MIKNVLPSTHAYLLRGDLQQGGKLADVYIFVNFRRRQDVVLYNRPVKDGGACAGLGVKGNYGGMLLSADSSSIRLILALLPYRPPSRPCGAALDFY